MKLVWNPVDIWVWNHTCLFLCILTGVAAVIYQVIVASDYLPKSKGVHAHPHSLSCAMPGDWFPSDTSIDGNEGARITSAKLLRKPEAPWCVMHTLVKAALLRVYWNIIKYQVSKWCHVWEKVLLWVPGCWAALVVVTCKVWEPLDKWDVVSLLHCLSLGDRGLQGHISGTLKYS